MPPDLRGAIKDELLAAIERLGAHPYLLAIVGSWGDNLDDEAVLEALKDWNSGDFKMEMISSTGDVPRVRPKLRSLP